MTDKKKSESKTDPPKSFTGIFSGECIVQDDGSIKFIPDANFQANLVPKSPPKNPDAIDI